MVGGFSTKTIKTNKQLPKNIFSKEFQSMTLSKLPSCGCRNINIKVCPLPHGICPNLPDQERAHVVACVHLSALRHCPLDVPDLSRISIASRSPICTDVVCSGCSDIFRFFSTRILFCVGRIPVGLLSLETGKNAVSAILTPLLSRLPPIVARSVKAMPDAVRKAVQENENPNELDFEVMFGNQSKRFVGSCADRVIQLPLNSAMKPSRG
jgi:hypothetical protein